MKRLLSHYSPRLMNNLIYMLQQTEYNAGDYLAWYHRAADLARVQKRGKLTLTKAARVLQLASMAIVAGWLGLAWLITANWLVVAGALLVVPWLLAYSLAGLAWGARGVIQPPREYLAGRWVKRQLRDHPALRIGIAGSFGKTTMKQILKTVLSEGKKVAATPANYNTPLGIKQFVQDLSGDEEVLIFELGEYYPGDVARLCAITMPDCGVITGVTKQHMQRFGTLEAARDTIFELADYLHAGQPLYVNGESEEARPAIQPHHFVYSARGVGEWKFSHQTADLDGTSFIAKCESQELSLSTELIGPHQIGPIGVAVDLAHKMGLSGDQIKRGVGNIKPVEHRLQVMRRTGGVTVLDDTYNGNPEGFRRTLEFIKDLDFKRTIYVTPGIAETGPAKESIHRALGKQIARAADVVVLPDNSAAPFILQGLKEAGFGGQIKRGVDTARFLNDLEQVTHTGDLVVLQNDWGDQHA